MSYGVRRIRRRKVRVFIAVMAVAMVIGLPTALAGKGGNGNQQVAASISLNTAESLRSSAPSLGSTVDFTVTHAKKIKDPRVAVRCYQDGVMVYAMAGPADYDFLLGGAMSDWLMSGGSADCTAELFWLSSKGSGPQQYETLAWTSFWAAG